MMAKIRLLLAVKNMVSSEKKEILVFVVLGISLVKIRYNIGARTEPWGTPATTKRDDDRLSSIFTQKVLS